MKLIHWTLTAFLLSISGPLQAEEPVNEQATTEETKENADKAMTDLEKAEAAKKKAAAEKLAKEKKAKGEEKAQDEEAPAPAEEVAPATPEATPVVAPVVAAPVAAPTTGMSVVKADVSATLEEDTEAEEDKKPWKVSLSLGHSVGAGSFQSNPYLRERVESANQSWGLSGSYRFDLWGHKLSAGAGTSLSVSLVEPQGVDDRYVRLGNTRFSLSDGEVYKDEWSGVGVSAGASYSAPTSVSSQHGSANYGGLSTNVGLSRSFGDFNVSLGTTLSHTLYKNSVAQAIDTAPISSWSRLDEHCTAAIASGDEGDTFYQCALGSPRTFLTMGHSLNVSYSVTELLSVSYSLGFSNSFQYAVQSESDEYTATGSATASPSMDLIERNPDDNSEWIDAGASGEITNAGADTGVGLSQRFNSGLSVSYGLSKGIAEWVQLPFSLSMNASMSVSHPAQYKEDGSIWFPLFFNSFGDNKSAGNYGRFSVGLSGSY